MFNTLSNTLQTSLQQVVDVISPFALSSIKGFPYIRYMAQLDAYKELESWYLGTVLNVEVIAKDSGKKFERYPLKLNPIKGTVEKHATTLIGNSDNVVKFGGMPFQFTVNTDYASGESAKTVERALNRVWAENAGGALCISNALQSQYLGGCVFGANWIAEENRIRIVNPSPKEFIGIPDGNDFWHLRECWIVKELNRIDLIQYGFDPDLKDNRWHYIEHWTRDTYEISMNNHPLQVGGQLAAGKNPFGVVPYVYIPHIRVWSYYGDSLITDAVRGLVREMNLRFADIGDAVQDDSHGYITVRNVRGNIKTIFLANDSRPIYDLGSTTGLTGNEANPEMMAIKPQSASKPMLEFAEDLYQLYRIEANHPAVADGVDEGSQRSALTIATRMAPLTSHVELERTFWSVGMMEFSRILLHMMCVKNQHGITKELEGIPVNLRWLPMLPKDREELISEVDMRARNELNEAEELKEMLGDMIVTDTLSEPDAVPPIAPTENIYAAGAGERTPYSTNDSIASSSTAYGLSEQGPTQ